MRDTNQLHAAVVELVALDNAQVKYSTVQNWYPGDKEGKGGIYNFVTKRGACRGVNSKIPGPRLRPAPPSPGSIQAACLWAITRSAILLRRLDQQLPAGRHRNQDGAHRQEHHQHHRFQRHLRRTRAEHYRGGVKILKSAEGARQLLAVRFAPDGR